MIIKPLEFCEGKFLRAREKFWMQELNTIFPYGLNSLIDISGIHDAYQHAKSKSNIPTQFSTLSKLTGDTTSLGNETMLFNPADFFFIIWKLGNC